MMFPVMANFLFPDDPTGKKRLAIALGLHSGSGRVMLAPVTTTPSRTGRTPRGAVLIPRTSPVWEKASFSPMPEVTSVAIRLRETGLYLLDSKTVKDLRHVGMLDLKLDKRLLQRFRSLLDEYDLNQAKTF